MNRVIRAITPTTAVIIVSLRVHGTVTGAVGSGREMLPFAERDRARADICGT